MENNESFMLAKIKYDIHVHSPKIPTLSRRIDRFKLGFQVRFAALALQVEST